MGKKSKLGWPRTKLIEGGQLKDELLRTIVGRVIERDIIKAMGETARQVFIDAGILVATQDNWRIDPELDVLTLPRLCKVAKDAENAVHAEREDVDALKALFDPVRGEVRDTLSSRRNESAVRTQQLRQTLEGLEWDMHIYRGALMLGVVTQEGKVRFPMGAYSVGTDLDIHIVTLLPCSDIRDANTGDVVLVECNGIPNRNINAASCNVREVVPPGMVSHARYQFSGSSLLAKCKEKRLAVLAASSGGEENLEAYALRGGDAPRWSAEPPQRHFWDMD